MNSGAGPDDLAEIAQHRSFLPSRPLGRHVCKSEARR